MQRVGTGPQRSGTGPQCTGSGTHRACQTPLLRSGSAGRARTTGTGFVRRAGSGRTLVRCAAAAGLELREQLVAAVILVGRAATARLDVLAQLDLEAIRAGAVAAHGEMQLDHAGVVLGEQLVEICLHAALRVPAGSSRRTHDAAASAVSSIVWASSVLSMRRPRWRRDMIVPMGTSRMSAAS